MIITGTEKKQSKIILTTSQVILGKKYLHFIKNIIFLQAFQIANLIREYSQVVRQNLTDHKKTVLPPPPVPEHSIGLTTSKKGSKIQFATKTS